MEILKLRLKGFIGIKKGLGLEEIEIDFSELKGLVAFDGPNGHGKTTILDNLHPFRCLASRSKALQHHVFLRDSEKELTFKFGDDIFRTLVKIDSESGRQEGFVFKNGSPESEVKGKTPEYDKYIVDLFGTQSLFFNSIFCAQNADKISDMTTGDLKALFSEFLKLDELINYENTAKQCVNILTGQEEGKDKKIETLSAEIYSLKLSGDIIDDYKNELDSATKLNDVKHLALKQTEKKLIETKESLSKEGVIVQRIEDQKKVAEQLKTDIATDEANTNQTLDEKRTIVNGLRDQKKAEELLLSEKDSIIKANDVAVIEKKILAEIRDRLEVKQNEKTEALNALNETKNNLAKKENEFAVTQSDPKIKDIERKIIIVNDKLNDLSKKDPDCKSETCTFIVGALEAEKELPSLNENLKGRTADIAILQSTLQTELQVIAEQLENQSILCVCIKEEYAILFDDITKSETILNEAEQKAKLLPEITGAEERFKNLKKREDELISEGSQIKRALDNRTKVKKEQLTAVETILSGLESGLDSALKVLALTLQNEIDDLKNFISTNEEKITSVTVKIEKEKDNEAELKSKSGQLATLEIEKQLIKKEISDWQYLKNACSKDGLRALEIDSVSPIITGYANDLLNSSFGPDYTVKFRTLDENGKECLDILAIRNDGSEVLLDNLSGGEKVWSLKALRQAMTLLSKEKSGRNFLTALADEEDGALNMENAINFVSMYRSFMASGGFTTCFFITHRKECVALADHVLTFLKGGIKIER